MENSQPVHDPSEIILTVLLEKEHKKHLNPSQTFYWVLSKNTQLKTRKGIGISKRIKGS